MKENMTVIEKPETYQQGPGLRVGEVMPRKQELCYDKAGRPYYRDEVRVGDLSDRDPVKRHHYRVAGDMGERWLIDNPEPKKTIVRRKTREVIIDPSNQAALGLYYDAQGNPTTMLEWAKDFPDAIALYALQHPDTDGGRMLESGVLDTHTKENFLYMLDAIGIRARAAIYSQKIVELAATTDAPRLTIMSVGSGAAVPNINATKRVESELGKHIDWHFFDIDSRALEFAETLIAEAEFEDSTIDYGPLSADPESGKKFEGRSYEDAYEEDDESFDVVDALGLWEYLRDETAIVFAKNLYAKVKPGGKMLVSNMLPNRPQREFNKRGVGWPNLFLRSEEDLLEIFSKAGIDTANVTMTYSEDGIYVVAEIIKP